MRKVTPFDARDYYYYYGAGERGRRGAIFGGGFSAEAQALFAEMEVEPTAARKAVIDTFIRALKSGGVWAKLDVLYVFAAHTEQAALLNWVNPGTFDATESGSLTFTADEGIEGAGGYIETGFNPTSASGNYTLNSASYGVWCRTDASTASGAAEMSANDGAGNSFLGLGEGGDGEIRWRINTASSAQNAGAGSTGLFIANRSGAATNQLFKNGAQHATSTTAAAALPNTTFSVLRNTGGIASIREVSLACIGASMDATTQDALYDAALAYMQAVGAV